MTALVVLIGLSLLVALGFLGAFFWAVRRGQYDDTSTPALRMLHDDIAETRPLSEPQSNQNP